MLAVQRAKYLENDGHDVSADDIRVYFESISAQLTSTPSAFQKNADETRVGSAEHMSPPEVIVASGTKPGLVAIPEIRGDAQLTFLTVISAFGNSTYPYYFKNKTFEKTGLEAQQLSEGHDYTIRTSPKTFITETLFIDWIEMAFLVRINYFCQKFPYENPVILLVNGHLTHITPGSWCFAERTALSSLGWSYTAVTSCNRSIYSFSGFSRFSIKTRSRRNERKERHGKYTRLSFPSIKV
jgi:hypothetical protein